MTRVAALYTLARGPYSTMEGVDAWPARRDARLYRGPFPVVAHPPCGPWSRSYEHVTSARVVARDRHLAPNAVLQVRKWGGVLEHPARSRLWEVMSLPLPFPYRSRPELAPRDRFGGFTVEVRQCDWGHVAIKRTWLYLCGVDPDEVEYPPPGRPALPPESYRIDSRDGSVRQRTAFDLLSPEARKRTPLALAEWLVNLAGKATRSNP